MALHQLIRKSRGGVYLESWMMRFPARSGPVNLRVRKGEKGSRTPCFFIEKCLTLQSYGKDIATRH